MNDELFAGFDLHSNNVMCGIINQDGKRVKHKKLDCDLDQILDFLEPFKEQLKGLAVESTYNWYWLVDGLRANSYNIELVNVAEAKQYEGLKFTDDKYDAFFLAEMQRLKILPIGFIYDPLLRPVRDLLRRRQTLVHHRTALILSFKSLYIRTTGKAMSQARMKAMTLEEVKTLYEHPANILTATIQFQHIGQLNQSVGKIDKAVMESASELPCFTKLKTIPGIGDVLATLITMEVGDIKRFPSAGDFASYCRTVKATRSSNNKKKANNNSKCGNKYLGWAFIEAANFAKRSDSDCRSWFDRKTARTNKVIATKALACKLAKAAWYIMANQTDYDSEKIFPKQSRRSNLGEPLSNQPRGLDEPRP